jgi:hypothetical protein
MNVGMLLGRLIIFREQHKKLYYQLRTSTVTEIGVSD